LAASQAGQLTATLDAADYRLESAVKAKLDEVTIEFRRGDAAR
jgi:1-deoxyxylulose-5-phosphate synthase